MDRRTLIARELLDYINNKGIDFVVLRNFDQLMSKLGHDLDLVVSKKIAKTFLSAVQEFCNTKKLGVFLVQSRSNIHSIAIIDPEEPFVIRIDILFAFDFRGLNILTYDDILSHSHEEEGVKVASMEHQVVIILFKQIYYVSFLEEKHIERISRVLEFCDRSKIELVIGKTMGRKLGTIITNELFNRNFGRIEQLCNAIVIRTIIRATVTKPIRTLAGFSMWLLSYLLCLARKRGVFLVLLGPDGSGKSTVLNTIKNEMNYQLFNNIICHHGHFGILPRFGELLRKLKKQNEPLGYTNSASPKEVHSSIKASLYILYYGLDYFLGRISIGYNRARSNLVIFDRYYHDYYLQHSWDKVPRFLLRLVERTVPKPDILFLLEAPPDMIHERKPELSVREISSQQERMFKILQRTEGAVILKTDKSLDVIYKEVLKQVLTVLRKRRCDLRAF